MSKYYIKYTQHEYNEDSGLDTYHEETDVVEYDDIYKLLRLTESYGQNVHTIVRLDDPETMVVTLHKSEASGICDIINGTVDTLRGWASDEEIATEVPYWERILEKLKGE